MQIDLYVTIYSYFSIQLAFT